MIGKKIETKYLFIDDGSTDQTKRKLIEFKKKNQFKYTNIFS